MPSESFVAGLCVIDSASIINYASIGFGLLFLPLTLISIAKNKANLFKENRIEFTHQFYNQTLSVVNRLAKNLLLLKNVKYWFEWWWWITEWSRPFFFFIFRHSIGLFFFFFLNDSLKCVCSSAVSFELLTEQTKWKNSSEI